MAELHDENNNSSVAIVSAAAKLTDVLNKLDFRGFGVVDCLFDSLMNLREMAPAACRSLSQYYDELLSTNKAKCKEAAQNDEVQFDQLLRRCVYKLVNDFRAVVFCMPRITTKLQALEFMKILAFMCKFPNRVICKTNEETNFEMFCMNFLRKFILEGELLNLRSRQCIGFLKLSSFYRFSIRIYFIFIYFILLLGSNGPNSCQQLDTNDSDILIDLLDAFYRLVQVVLRSSSARQHHIFNQQHVRLKLVSMLRTYFVRLVDHFGQANIMTSSTAVNASSGSASSPLTPGTTLLSSLANSSPDTDDDGIFSSSSCGTTTTTTSNSTTTATTTITPPAETISATVMVSSPQLVAANHYHSIDDYIYYRSKLIDYKLKIERLDASLNEHKPRSLKVSSSHFSNLINTRLNPCK